MKGVGIKGSCWINRGDCSPFDDFIFVPGASNRTYIVIVKGRRFMLGSPSSSTFRMDAFPFPSASSFQPLPTFRRGVTCVILIELQLGGFALVSTSEPLQGVSILRTVNATNGRSPISIIFLPHVLDISKLSFYVQMKISYF